jgi:hypothetical protein
MPATREPIHPDDLEDALAHFNGVFRFRYRLPPTTELRIRECDGFAEAFNDLPAVRVNGVNDASCAVIARCVLSTVPRYAIGFLDGAGHVTVDSPNQGDPRSYESGHVLLVNPLGGRNTWGSVSRWVRQDAENMRRAELAGRASERRPDIEANDALLRQAMIEHDRTTILPPDEGFSSAFAAEVSYIYDVPPETLRSWKRRYRKDIASGKAGAPRRNR